jgi:hypothetical protein
MSVRSPVIRPLALRQPARSGGDIEVTLPPPHGPTMLDTIMIHPRCLTYVATASQATLTTAALRYSSKFRAHPGHLHAGQIFKPASVQTYRHSGKPIMRYLCTLSDAASACSVALTRGSFLASKDRELSVALVQSQGYVYHCCALLHSKDSGRQDLPGAGTPFLD